MLIFQALTKRNAQNGPEQSGVGPSNSNSNAGSSIANEQMLQSSLRRKNSSPSCFDVLLNTVSLVRSIPRDRQKLATLAKQLGNYFQIITTTSVARRGQGVRSNHYILFFVLHSYGTEFSYLSKRRVLQIA